MKLLDLTKIFRDTVDDAAQPYLWTDEEILDYANEAEEEACRRSRLIVDATTAAICTISVISGTAIYALDPRVIFVLRAKMASSSLILPRASVLDMDETIPGWESHTGTARSFIVDAGTGKIRLYRTPNENGTLNLTVVRMPLEPMNSMDDSPEISPRFHRNLRHWLMYRAFSKNDAETKSDEKAAAALKSFEEEFGIASRAVEETFIERNYDQFDGHF